MGSWRADGQVAEWVSRDRHQAGKTIRRKRQRSATIVLSGERRELKRTAGRLPIQSVGRVLKAKQLRRFRRVV
jgi:hypothetical protein